MHSAGVHGCSVAPCDRCLVACPQSREGSSAPVDCLDSSRYYNCLPRWRTRARVNHSRAPSTSSSTLPLRCGSLSKPSAWFLVGCLFFSARDMCPGSLWGVGGFDQADCWSRDATTRRPGGSYGGPPGFSCTHSRQRSVVADSHEVEWQRHRPDGSERSCTMARSFDIAHALVLLRCAADLSPRHGRILFERTGAANWIGFSPDANDAPQWVDLPRLGSAARGAQLVFAYELCRCWCLLACPQCAAELRPMREAVEVHATLLDGSRDAMPADLQKRYCEATTNRFGTVVDAAVAQGRDFAELPGMRWSTTTRDVED